MPSDNGQVDAVVRRRGASDEEQELTGRPAARPASSAHSHPAPHRVSSPVSTGAAGVLQLGGIASRRRLGQEQRMTPFFRPGAAPRVRRGCNRFGQATGDRHSHEKKVRCRRTRPASCCPTSRRGIAGHTRAALACRRSRGYRRTACSPPGRLRGEHHHRPIRRDRRIDPIFDATRKSLLCGRPISVEHPRRWAPRGRRGRRVGALRVLRYKVQAGHHSCDRHDGPGEGAERARDSAGAKERCWGPEANTAGGPSSPRGRRPGSPGTRGRCVRRQCRGGDVSGLRSRQRARSWRIARRYVRRKCHRGGAARSGRRR